MIRRYVLNLHLYIGLILSVTILMLPITGIYLNHQHDWFHKQEIHYINPDYDSIVDHATVSVNQGWKRVPEAVEKAQAYGLFTNSDIDSVNYATHGLGYFYYVHLTDDKDTIIVVTETGEIAKTYSDPLIKKWMRNLQVGMANHMNFVFVNDLTTLSVIF